MSENEENAHINVLHVPEMLSPAKSKSEYKEEPYKCEIRPDSEI